jgi:hypothetical protein
MAWNKLEIDRKVKKFKENKLIGIIRTVKTVDM